MEKKRILLVGESWVTSANHTKGWDTFSSVTFHLGAEPLGARHTMARPAWGERGEGQGASGCAGHCAPPGRSRWPSPACGWKPWKWPYPGMDVRYRAALAAKRLRRMAGLQAALDSGARLARPIVVPDAPCPWKRLQGYHVSRGDPAETRLSMRASHMADWAAKA